MPEQKFFPQRPEAKPQIYAFVDVDSASYKGLLKVGYTTRSVEERVREQYSTKLLDEKHIPYQIVFQDSAMRADGSAFTDHEVHRVLKKQGFHVDKEWFRCAADDVKKAVAAVRGRCDFENARTESFKMRPEQMEAVEKTASYFSRFYEENNINPDDAGGLSAKFLWNCKMRFGKTFAAYELAKKMDFKRILILTFKPAVRNAWREDLLEHVDFEGWQFITRPECLGEPLIDEQYRRADKSRPIVCFGSFQDFLSYDKTIDAIRIKDQNKWVHEENWDLVIFDEYHFGAWTDKAKSLFDQEDEDSFECAAQKDPEKFNRGDAYNESYLPITANYYLYLSGTPFRAINTGEFIEEQIYNWTYSDEQRAKAEWEERIEKGEELPGSNPYASMPRMVMMTYRIPESIRHVAALGEFDEFDLNEFFATEGKGKDAKFKHEWEVQKWLDLIRGSLSDSIVDDLKLGSERPPMPYSHVDLLNILQHTLWFLPNVASCFAMKNLLDQKQNKFYHDYAINVCAGSGAGIGSAALEPIRKSMENPLETKTITLSCGKLTTGVTVRPWTGIFMLRNLSSPETYFQAAFRVQSPWEVSTDATDKTKKEIIKKECYVFDFALDRALKQISDYSCRLDLHESNPEKKVSDFIKFLPVLAYDGSAMKAVSASEILDLAMSGTSATLLARRWESALLVNVDNNTLARLLANKEALDAIMKIEDFRSLNSDIETIINRSNAVKKMKTAAQNEGRPLTKAEKKEISEAEKEYKSKRKMIQQKLIKFATRIPIFMYLTDHREMALTDVIRTVEPPLFRKVTGLEVKDFDLLTSIGLFDEAVMNEAVYKFRRYEDSSLTYTGIDKHENEKVGGWNTVVSSSDYKKMFDSNSGSSQENSRNPYDPGISGKTAFSSFSVGLSNPESGMAVAESGESYIAKSDEKERTEGTERTEETENYGKSENPAESRKSDDFKTNVPESGIPMPEKPKSGNPQNVQKSKKKQTFHKATASEIAAVKSGDIVYHKAFGLGTVISVKNDTIYTNMKGINRNFRFPFAFEKGFLLLADD